MYGGFTPPGLALNYKKIRRCSPKYANLDKSEIDVKESEIESFPTVKQLF
jgi:hypothetical protein